MLFYFSGLRFVVLLIKNNNTPILYSYLRQQISSFFSFFPYVDFFLVGFQVILYIPCLVFLLGSLFPFFFNKFSMREAHEMRLYKLGVWIE